MDMVLRAADLERVNFIRVRLGRQAGLRDKSPYILLN